MEIKIQQNHCPTSVDLPVTASAYDITSKCRLPLHAFCLQWNGHNSFLVLFWIAPKCVMVPRTQSCYAPKSVHRTHIGTILSQHTLDYEIHYRTIIERFCRQFRARPVFTSGARFVAGLWMVGLSHFHSNITILKQTTDLSKFKVDVDENLLLKFTSLRIRN